VEGTLNVLEAAQHAGIRRFVYTSSIHAIKRIGGQYLIDIQDHPSYTFNCVAERLGEYWE
jgi:nucleoside-diphosphate-sugar epimerase